MSVALRPIYHEAMVEKLCFAAEAGFEAARQLSCLPEGHPSRRLHGHGFVAQARAESLGDWARFPGDEVEALQRRLGEVVAPLDHQPLNTFLAEPTDENLARWIQQRLHLPQTCSVGIQSTRRGGVEIDRTGDVHVWRSYVIQSAHQLPHVPPGHKCSRMHGHTFRVVLRADYGAPPADSALAYDRLDELWAPVHTQLDHACLNDIPGLENPTSELLASWIWNRMKRELPQLSLVVVHETASCGARFDGCNHGIWKDFAFDSARRLERAPESDGRRKLHGLTCMLRLHLHGPLDEAMGWTVDFGDVKESFTPVFLELDHQPLHEVLHQEPDAATLAKWIGQRTKALLPQLARIDLYETPGCGVIVSWNESERGLSIA